MKPNCHKFPPIERVTDDDVTSVITISITNNGNVRCIADVDGERVNEKAMLITTMLCEGVTVLHEIAVSSWGGVAIATESPPMLVNRDDPTQRRPLFRQRQKGGRA